MTNNLNMKTRKSNRRKCRLMGTVIYLNHQTSGRVVDLSATGIALDLAGPLHAAAGSKVRIESDELGHLEGFVRWYHSSRVGIEFAPTSNADAKVSSYFRFFHKEVRPVLTR